MPKSRPPYPAEYRAELVRLVREEGRTPADLAKEFEPSAQSITNWVAQAEIDAGRRDGPPIGAPGDGGQPIGRAVE